MTAKEFINQYNRLNDSSRELLMIGFAKYHIQEFLNKIKENAESQSYIDIDYVLDAYPLENIK